MRRRRVLTAVAGATLSGLAGCAAPQLDRHPFADRTVTVRVDDESETPHDVHAVARDALEYWTEHAAVYAGFAVDFDVVSGGVPAPGSDFDSDSNPDPDVRLRFVDQPDDCRGVENYSERVLGCAPLLRPGYRLPSTVEAIVVAASRPVGKIGITTKHELGHLLGLGHDDEPQEIMSHDPERRIPQYALRTELWSDVLEAKESAQRAGIRFDAGRTAWNADRYGDAESAFRAATDEFDGARTRFESIRERSDAFETDPRVETVDLEGLRGHLEGLRERMTLAAAAAEAMAESANAAADGDHATAASRQSAANEYLRAFDAISSPELRDIAIALGLVRGFDRDEPVVDVGVDVDSDGDATRDE